ncbi:hypothetical protein A1O3_05990 [Capronia epimyces CBS 606.96]|uniref:Short chain dehydrogenase n=1 Tax=Capronia epimyces CBS 606.96 TaxID=1182542 RepID=W9Y6Q7_9EURO|nr:uncharacterized protein A1O3_05990 [Capronia epimyces CBS 606.96]EXJ85315.1 hypothetical protein A1O3_05990 [Capronia epimyces CBS 606.96]
MASPSQTIVLITGANQGLGYEAVKKLAAEQADYVILLGSRNPERGHEAAGSITSLAKGTSVVPLVIDIDSDESITRAAQRVDETYGRLDVLFNNAGISTAGPGAGDSLREQMRSVIETNLISTAVTTEAFIPLLQKSRAPRLLFMSSGIGSIGNMLDPSFPMYGVDSKPYSTSKASLNMLAALYSVQYGKQGFKVNVICPGYRATRMNGYADTAGKPEEGIIAACDLVVDAEGKSPNGAFISQDNGFWPW